eukprot:CAMPEP_0114538316 /NCGR_PEP_ID=MMETSP0109-20121206/30073_1 /TAXON_ID=29199 /ORGANISM="Chlorarachnion reptans, Strain CCCM449" /LENGTH=976 /DNA_ID=CAMNT_0001722317 /DNA_START=10 /DNA_END=2941 /DNA_ORIENTATION=+
MPTNALEKNCTLVLPSGSAPVLKSESLLSQLESKKDEHKIEALKTVKEKDEHKIEALKTVISSILHGEDMSRLLMPIIKFCTQSSNHTLKKLLLIYWECLDMYGSDGKLRPEMILVCEGMKKNLIHPNEYVRGSTLRFLCKLKEADILQSLIPSITGNLEHRNAYVRKYAVLSVFHIHNKFPNLIPDAPDLIEKILESEVDSAARRNAFLVLYHADEQKAMAYLYSNLDQLESLGESFQLVALELIRKVSRTKAFAEVKSRYLRCIYALTECPSNPVAYEAANTLISLSAAPIAVRRAIAAYTRLLAAESDSSVKLIIISKLKSLKKRHETVLSDMIMDVLRSLSTPNNDIRQKTLDLCLRLLSPRNVQSVVNVLKKELLKTDSPSHEDKDSLEYRKILVDSLHRCAVKFPEVVPSVVHLLMNYVGDENTAGAKDVILFVRHIVEEYPKLRSKQIDEIRSSGVYRVALWILGEYTDDMKVLNDAISTVTDMVGPLPMIPRAILKEGKADEDEEEGKENVDKKAVVKREQKSKILADGTYASEGLTPSEDMKEEDENMEEDTKLRALLLSGDSFLAACLAGSLTKMTLRFCTLKTMGSVDSRAQIGKTLLLLSSLLRIGEYSPKTKKSKLDRDSRQRILTCIHALLHPKTVSEALLKLSRESFREMLKQIKSVEGAREEDDFDNNKEVDDVITVRQLCPEKELYDVEGESRDVKKAVGAETSTLDINSKLSRVYQLTGFADSVYAEAYLTVLDFDILLDILVVNQTDESLQNLTVELNTSGDLKIADRIQEHTIAPKQSKTINVSIKVSSTESGVIFGSIAYSTAKGVDKKIVVLNSIHMDIMDYIHPANCTDTEFRSMWAEFEWENKVSVNTDFTELTSYLNHIVKITNMKCLTPDVDQYSECGFLAANLYACSIFGEDALLNLSVEQNPVSRKITGYVRIRSKTQGVALSLGDKITSNQRRETKASTGDAKSNKS